MIPLLLYRSLNAIVAQSKNCPFGVNTTTELKNITTSDNTAIWQGVFQVTSVLVLSDVLVTLFSSIVIFFFLSLNLLIGLQLSIWNCCKPFFSLLYNCQLLCFWRVALSIVVEVFPWPFFSRYCSFKDVYYNLVMPNCMPCPSVASVF